VTEARECVQGRIEGCQKSWSIQADKYSNSIGWTGDGLSTSDEVGPYVMVSGRSRLGGIRRWVARRDSGHIAIIRASGTSWVGG
jgi:hypothetical protein